MKKKNYMNKLCLFSFGFFLYSGLVFSSDQEYLKDEKERNLKEFFVLEFAIADPRVSAMPIQDNNDSLVDLEELNNPRIRSFFSFPDYQAISKCEGYSSIRKRLSDSLIKMLTFLPNNIGIVYFEGYRPLSRQIKYFSDKYGEFRKEGLTPDKAYEETSKYVSPFIQNVPTHCTGAAIDITLFKIDGEQAAGFLDLGKFGTIFGPNDQSHTFCDTISPEQRENRIMLLEAAKQVGLVNYGYEWWHYSYGDKAWAYMKNKEYAVYGLIISDISPYSSKAEFIEDMEDSKS